MNIISSREASALLEMELDSRLENPGYVWGKSWGFPTLDKMTGGIHDSELTTLIARSGVGKSAVAGKIALHVAKQLKEENKVVRIVSLEMNATSYRRRQACVLSGVPSRLVRAGFPGVPDVLKAQMVGAYRDALHELEELPIEYVQEEISLDNIQEFIEFKGNCGFWVLDHIGIIPGAFDARNQTASIANSWERVRRICRYVAPGFILSQMNREADRRQDKRPTLADAYGTMYAEANSNNMMGLYREGIYLNLPPPQRNKRQPAELLVLKQREGQTGTIHLIFEPNRVDFVEDTELNEEPVEDGDTQARNSNQGDLVALYNGKMGAT